uniref:spermatogenesis-associated protein 31-like n=1 Tax=Jaculus jaculus TaxID=51337 RepID=UPI001E1B20C5|nr:spermatogenesis-associated protein 31-like [Jaculus jaculus]
MDTQKVSYTKTPRENFQQKSSQLFWGLPSLHSESLGAAAWIPQSSSVLESPFFLFNGVTHVCPVPVQAKMSPVHSMVSSLSYLESPSPPLMLSLSKFQCATVGQVQMQPHLPFSTQVKSPASLRVISDCEPTCLQPHNMPNPSIPTETQYLKKSSMWKKLKSGSFLPLMGQRPQEVHNVCTPGPCQHWVVSSILPENFPVSPEAREQLEHHLQTWLIQHRWELPRRIQESLEVMQHQDKLTKASQAHLKPGPSRSSGSSTEHAQVIPKVRFQLRKESGKNLAQILGKVPKGDVSRGLERYPVNSQGATSAESENNLVKCLKTDSKSGSLGNTDRNEESILKTHVGTKSAQIKRGLFPLTLRRSWLAVNCGVSVSEPHTDTGYLASSKSSDKSVRTSQLLPFLDTHTREVLEAHIVKFWLKHCWGLPLKVIKPVKLLKWRKAHLLALPLCAPPTSSPRVSGAHPAAELVPFLGKPSQAYLTEVVLDESPSSSSLGSLVLVPSPSCPEIKRALMGSPSADERGLLNTAPSQHESRCPLATVKYNQMGQASQSRTVLETGQEKPEVSLLPARSVSPYPREPAETGVVSECECRSLSLEVGAARQLGHGAPDVHAGVVHQCEHPKPHLHGEVLSQCECRSPSLEAGATRQLGHRTQDLHVGVVSQCEHPRPHLHGEVVSQCECRSPSLEAGATRQLGHGAQDLHGGVVSQCEHPRPHLHGEVVSQCECQSPSLEAGAARQLGHGGQDLHGGVVRVVNQFERQKPSLHAEGVSQFKCRSCCHHADGESQFDRGTPSLPAEVGREFEHRAPSLQGGAVSKFVPRAPSVPAQAGRELEPQVEMKLAAKPQRYGPEELLPHCSRALLLAAHGGTSQRIREPVIVWGSDELTQQKPSVPKQQDSQKGPSKALAPMYQGDEKLNADLREERAKVQKTSKFTQAKGQENTVQKKSHWPLPNTQQAPAKSPFQRMMHRFLHWILPKKSIKAQVEPPKKGKPPSTTVKSQRQVKKPQVDSNVAEAQKLMATVGQILEKKMIQQSKLCTPKTNQPKEPPPPPVCPHPLCQSPPSSSERKRLPSHLAAPCSQRYPVQERHVGGQGSLKSVRFTKEQQSSQHPHLKLTNEAPLVSPSKQGTIVPGASNHHQRCPRHCVNQTSVLYNLLENSTFFTSGKTYLKENV